MQRVFAISKNDNEIFLDKEDVFHFNNVLRMKVNEKFEAILDGKLYLCFIKNLKPFIALIEKEIFSYNELDNDITLYFVASKGDKNELVIQKCSELGVNHIVFLTSDFCVLKSFDIDNKKERYIKIAKSASMQSKRMLIPSIDGNKNIYDLNKDDLKDKNFFCYENINGSTKDAFSLFSDIKKGESVSILVGSEGGISEKEASHLKSIGFHPISVGKRILRAETCGICAISILSFFLERL